MMLRHSLSWAATCFPEVANGKSLANATIGEIDNFQILFWLCSACWLQRATINPNANGCQLTTTQLGCFWMVAPCSPTRGESIRVSMPSYNERRWPAVGQRQPSEVSERTPISWIQIPKKWSTYVHYISILYIYIYIFIYIYIYIYLYIYILYIYIYIYVLFIYIYIYVLYLYICIIYLFIYIYICIIVTHVQMLHVYINIHIHIYIYVIEREREGKKKKNILLLSPSTKRHPSWLALDQGLRPPPSLGAAWYSWDWACTRCEDLENLHPSWSAIFWSQHISTSEALPHSWHSFSIGRFNANLPNQIGSSSSSKLGVQIGEPLLPLWLAFVACSAPTAEKTQPGAGQKSWVGLHRGFRTMGVLLLIIKFTIKKTHLYQHLDAFLMNQSSDVFKSSTIWWSFCDKWCW